MTTIVEKGVALAMKIKRHGGWIEGDFIRFPTPHALALFEAEIEAERKAEHEAKGAKHA